MQKLYDVLIVEDDPSWQKRIVRYLKYEPFSFKLAASEQEAEHLIETHEFDLVILDVNLTNVPGSIGGLYIGEKLWYLNSQVSIIIVSGSEQMHHNLDSTAFTFVPKYVFSKGKLDRQEFIQCVQAALGFSEK